MISQETIQQITNRIDIVEIVGEFVKLKKRGANYLGNCPFHNEKTPSFTVSPSKDIYKCFGCGKSGNAIGFVMEHEKYSYVEALKWIAARYNIAIEEKEVSPEVRQQQQVAESLFVLNSFAQKHLTNNLFQTEEGKTIGLSYLHHRGFADDILQKFQIGYNAEAKDDLTTSLIQNQFNLELAEKASLVSIRNNEPVDNYRGRIIFPIHNQSGKIIGFGARIIKSNDKAPKYINTQENEIYSKSKVLYGLFFARQAISKSDECLLVEGYTDVVSLHQAGVENVVASGGTSLTPDQLRLIRKLTNNLTIIYDGDTAGVAAALRGLDKALEEGLNVKLVLIPDNEDPDSYVRKIGALAFKEFVDQNKKDFIIFQLQVLLEQAGNDTAKRSAVVNQIAETLSKFQKAEDFVKQQDYIRQCASLLHIDEGGLTNLVNKLKRDKLIREESKQYDSSPQQTLPDTPDNVDNTLDLLINDDYQERDLMRVLLEHGLLQWDENETMADHIFEELEHYSIDNAEVEMLMNLYREQYNNGLHPTAKTLLYHENDSIRKLVINLTMQQYELSPNWDKKLEGMNINNRDISRQDVMKSLNYFKLKKLKKMFEENQKDIQNAQSIEEQMTFIKIHKGLKEEEQKITKELGTVIFK